MGFNFKLLTAAVTNTSDTMLRGFFCRIMRTTRPRRRRRRRCCFLPVALLTIASKRPSHIVRYTVLICCAKIYLVRRSRRARKAEPAAAKLEQAAEKMGEKKRPGPGGQAIKTSVGLGS
jgi:hypothetical protein